MLKTIAIGATALFVATSPLAYAQTTSPGAPGRLSAADLNSLTDLRIDLVKSALQLTPDQMKYWPAIENAIRNRAQERQARIAKIAETVGSKVDEGPAEILRNRDPVSFMQRRADALAQRAANLKNLANAWQPLYQTLSQEQKQRMAALTLFVLRGVSDAIEERGSDDD
ncbi:MAG TPA: Spy/CpxP family protein refolding chaperone [Pseudolabrys sp.]|nr:Spy/CpxP family protein refolding chaperone [Pseudolabrys sp.]